MIQTSKIFSMTIAALALYGGSTLLMEVATTTEAAAASQAEYDGPAGYLPAQTQNQAREVETQPNAYGDLGLATSHPEMDPASLDESVPQIYG